MRNLSLRIIDIHSKAFDELCRFEGNLYNDWLTIWESLSENEKDVFSHPVWVISWLKSPGNIRSYDYKLYVFHEGNQFITAMPFKINKQKTILGTKYWLCSALKDINIANSRASFMIPRKYCDDIFCEILNKNILPNIKPCGIFLETVNNKKTIYDSKFQTISVPGWPTAVLDTTKSYNEIKKKQTRKRKQNIRQAKNKLNKISDIKYKTFKYGEDFYKAYEMFIELENMGWKGSEGIGMKKNGITREFFLMLINGFIGDEVLFFHTLNTGNKLIASLLCYKQDSTLYLLHVTYNENYRSASPGMLLVDHVIKQSCDDIEIDSIDFISDYFSWIQTWKPETVQLQKIYLFSKGWQGFLTKAFYVSIDIFIKHLLFKAGLFLKVKKIYKNIKNYFLYKN
jgi:hypothetical protein